MLILYNANNIKIEKLFLKIQIAIPNTNKSVILPPHEKRREKIRKHEEVLIIYHMTKYKYKTCLICTNIIFDPPISNELYRTAKHWLQFSHFIIINGLLYGKMKAIGIHRRSF